jgi:predicted NUDIX family phosphoesterase
MLRELSEEMLVNSEYEEELVGFIFDDTSPVGRVHLGVVHRLKLSTPDARAREVDLVESGFEPVEQLKESLERFETWSQLCLRNLY